MLPEFPYNCPCCGLPLESGERCEIHDVDGVVLSLDDASALQDRYLAQQVLARTIIRTRVWTVLDAGVIQARRSRLGSQGRALQTVEEVLAWVVREYVTGYVEFKLLDGVTGQEIYPLTSKSILLLESSPEEEWIAHPGSIGVFDRLSVARLGATLQASSRYYLVFERAINAVDLQRRSGS